MTDKEFKTIANKLKTVYHIFETTDELDVWYELFCDSDYKILKQASENYILSNPFPPKPANIWDEYKKIESHIRECKRQILDDYLAALGHYPCSIDDATNRDAWGKAVSLLASSDEWSDRMRVSDRLMHLVASFAREIDNSSGSVLPRFGDYLRTIVDEYRS